MVSSPITQWQIDGETVETVTVFIFGELFLKIILVQCEVVIQKQRHYFANKGPSSQGYGFSSGHV